MPAKRSHRLRHHRAMCGTSAAPDRSAAPMKDSQMNIALACHAMQFPMRFIDFPQAGEHASVFVAVGVAQHHFLSSLP